MLHLKEHLTTLIRFSQISLIASAFLTSLALATTQEKKGFHDPKLPLTITADSLLLKSKERVFAYNGNVVVKQGDVLIQCDALEGTYSENNKVQTLTANKNVRIEKGPDIRGRSNLATYNADTQILTLKENPELDQNGSTLAADVIKVYLNENRSIAEGQVRVKMQPKDAKKMG